MINKKYVFLLAISGFVVALDQAIKLYIHTHYHVSESISVLPNLFNITYVRNYGAAFGFLARSHPIFREIFFLSMPPLALLLILGIMRGVSAQDKGQILALSSIFGGAVGNYLDRLRFRYVIDFLDFHYQNYYWPAFNIADMAIVCGVAFIIFQIFYTGNRRRIEKNKAA